MKVIWSIVGIVLLIIIVSAIYNNGKKTGVTTAGLSNVNNNPPVDNNSKTNNKTFRDIISTIAQPQPVIIVNGLVDCSGDTYNNNLSALYDVYLQKRVIWQNAINTDTNAIQAHADMDDAYNAWYKEAIKCNRTRVI